MKSVTLPQFYEEYLRLPTIDLPCTDHHYTGPLEAQTTHGEGGSLHHLEGHLLHSYAAKFGGHVLEIGADHGVSTRYIHSGLDRHPKGGVVVAVDFDHKWGEDAQWPRRRRLCYNSYRLLPHAVRCQLPDTVFSVDWAFIDGDHSYEGASRDFLLALSLGATSFFFHDISPAHVPYKCVNGNQSGSGVREFVVALDADPLFDVTEIISPAGMAFVECA